jgi:EAL domain-containing protein (putative c-di-GMP-specific phosphodiesterase class I)/ActR/RegA family two-component response regulator
MQQKAVLIIDDDPSICRFISRVCSRSGFDPIVASNPGDFATAIQNRSLLLVITDLQMPDFDGIEFMRMLADARTDVPVVILSGFDPRVLHTAEAFGRSIGLTIVDALQKPLSVPALRDLLETVAGNAAEHPETELATGIAHGDFVLFYQPKISVQPEDFGRVVGFEGLARWQHPGHGLVGPDRFIALAESTGRIDALTDVLMDRGLAEIQRWTESGGQFSLAFNLSPVMLGDRELADRIHSKVADAAVDPSRIIFEVTESGAMADERKTMEILTRLRLKGFELSIDDFGTGYSSLVKLYDLPFSELKIDRSFVRDIELREDAKVIVQTLIDLAHNLSLKVCAEGVETEAEWRLLVQYGCDRVQGYFAGRPMPATEIPVWQQQWADRRAEIESISNRKRN